MHNGTIDGRDYDGQREYTFCDVWRPWSVPLDSILGILNPVIHQIQQICRVYNSLRCLDHQIWQFLCDDNDDRTNHFTPAHVCGVIIIALYLLRILVKTCH